MMAPLPSKLLRDATPDLIFSDWKMPQMGGEDFLQHLRGEPRLAVDSRHRDYRVWFEP